MTASKVIVVTGASRGIGLAIARYLLMQSNKLVLAARSAGPLAELKEQYPGQVEFLAADLADFSTGPKVIELALRTFSRLDGLIINHGTLSPVQRIASCKPEEWRSSFDVNFFSAVAFIKPSIPHLRESNGRIVFTSSGAATKAYSTWGAYGASKAALNHLAMTLAIEEPDIMTVAVRPGTVDTDMQKEIRNQQPGTMDRQDEEKYRKLHEDGQLLKPEQPGNVIARLALGGKQELSGKFLQWNEKTLEEYQDG